MAWTEDEFRKAGYVQKKLRLKRADADTLKRMAKERGVKENTIVAELIREAAKKKSLA